MQLVESFQWMYGESYDEVMRQQTMQQFYIRFDLRADRITRLQAAQQAPAAPPGTMAEGVPSALNRPAVVAAMRKHYGG